MQQQQRHDRAATMPLPPEHPIVYWPCDMLTVTEMAVVRDWLKATLRCRGPEEFEKATKGWSLESRAEVCKALGNMRNHGFFPERIDENGVVVWGVQLKSPVQIELDRNEGWYMDRAKAMCETNGIQISDLIKAYIEKVEYRRVEMEV